MRLVLAVSFAVVLAGCPFVVPHGEFACVDDSECTGGLRCHPVRGVCAPPCKGEDCTAAPPPGDGGTNTLASSSGSASASMGTSSSSGLASSGHSGSAWVALSSSMSNPSSSSCTRFKDSDGDGYGDPEHPVPCTDPNSVPDASDCDDTTGNVHPGVTEECNGVDDDCDLMTDEGLRSTYYPDQDGDGFGGATVVMACSQPQGHVTTPGDCADGDATIKPGATEVCNGADDNCAGGIDEGVTTTFYRDGDGDGWGYITETTQACAVPTGYASRSGDCDDGDGSVHPDAMEACNGVDDNCADGIDEGVKRTFYLDGDGDTWGVAGQTTQACVAPSGYASRPGDCDDVAAAINPGAAELCNGVDDNCAGGIDEGVLITFYADGDSDTWGDPSVFTQACTAPGGYVPRAQDCNDGNGAIHPGATEVCNGADDNCAGGIDEGVTTTYFRDSDGDTWGLANVTLQACSAPSGYTNRGGDCNDGDGAIFPGAPERCNNEDDNCDTVTDGPSAPPGPYSVGTGTYSLVPGGNMEGNLAAWVRVNPSLGTVEPSTAQVFSGSQSARLLTSVDHSGSGYGMARVDVPVTPGTTYVLSGFFYRDQARTGFVYLDLADVANEAQVQSRSNLDGWHFATGTYTVPSGVTVVTVRVVRDGERRAGDQAYVDEVALTPINQFQPPQRQCGQVVY